MRLNDAGYIGAGERVAEGTDAGDQAGAVTDRLRESAGSEVGGVSLHLGGHEREAGIAQHHREPAGSERGDDDFAAR